MIIETSHDQKDHLGERAVLKKAGVRIPNNYVSFAFVWMIASTEEFAVTEKIPPVNIGFKF